MELLLIHRRETEKEGEIMMVVEKGRKFPREGKMNEMVWKRRT